MRIGQGYDVHAFSDDPARPLVVGGVTIEGAPGLAGHSDADVLAHAIADALLGAGHLGDLGSRFPATDEWKDISSLDILRQTAAWLREDGSTITYVDSTVVAQRPRLAPHKSEMEQAIAGALGVAGELVSVKATTTDRLGALGRGEGMAAYAVVLVAPA